MLRHFTLAAATLVAAQLTGCASIVSGTNQSVSVETTTSTGEAVAGANCKLSNNKGTWFVTTPGSTTVHRSYENLAVHCTKDAHEPGMVSAKSSTKAMAFGNAIFGGVIGVGVDVATGAAYDYPIMIKVRMGVAELLGLPVAAGASVQPPSLVSPTAAQR
jgi:hypothetical protein